ncbi:TPA: tyrosine-type recombinase/integrase [Pseudomonas aeruginosa]|uniref:tyrosine-type recombinase/integrase n=1 Tax=Pseudomonas aeruginosa TaxID=287 RepID=UPI001574147A|nr:tyrosine-type recombinase/integrase [Pseudomonas aeruginosa]MBA5014336.1 site-specific integrase [Pseudomonas aeruginosa]MBH9053211.1 site-specific integrase [Pseudomonas aeruginosa]MBI8700717.1 site-specific integrase [Pseudomonas aeruginosa]NTT94331.1 site-specific integrase [Pseudomonas aeruginosa]HCE8454055.1 site-specific integrase [Pseudomonas aeruginosa]
MPRAIVVEDDQLEQAVKVARLSSPENGLRDAALLLACFGTGMTVTELCRLKISDFLTQSGTIRIDSRIRAEIAYNHKSRPLCWTNKKLTNAVEAHLAERLERGHGVTKRQNAYRGLDPESPLFVSGRTGDGLRISAKKRDGKTYYSATQLSRLFTRLFEQAGVEGASAHSGRRTLAVKLKRRGIDLRHISEILGIESLEAVKKLCAGDPARLGEIVKRII